MLAYGERRYAVFIFSLKHRDMNKAMMIEFTHLNI